MLSAAIVLFCFTNARGADKITDSTRVPTGKARLALAFITHEKQSANPGALLRESLLARVTTQDGSPARNISLTFFVSSGGGRLMEGNSNFAFVKKLTLRSDRNGLAEVFFLAPEKIDATSIVTLQAGSGNSTVSASWSIHTIDDSKPPTAPSVPEIELENDESLAVIKWNGNPADTTHYVIERSENNSEWTTVAVVPADINIYRDRLPVPGRAYLYRIIAWN